MMQDYNFFNQQDYFLKNTWTKANKLQPSKKVIQTILSYARCTQNIKVNSKVLDFCLN